MKPDREYKGRSHIRMFNVDCMDFMKRVDEPYDLAIVDPPYRNQSENQPTRDMRKNGHMNIGDKPDDRYFNLLRDVSNRQIIWGANNYCYEFKGFFIWKKKTIGENFTMSMAEIASLSENLSTTCKFYEYPPQDPNRVHPNQKPAQIYRKLLHLYAEEGDRILDTHGGSMSIAIACWDLGFDLDICERDVEHFDNAIYQFEGYIAQPQLF